MRWARERPARSSFQTTNVSPGRRNASASSRPLSINGPKNNDKKMKWPVEAIGILLLQDALQEEKWEAHLMRFSSIRL
jgi:hypothetical protein